MRAGYGCAYEIMWAEMEPWAIILLVVVGLFALWLIIKLGVAAFAGAVVLLAFAGEQGFIGLAAYIALWVFLFPAMLIVCIIIGLITLSNKDD